MENKAETLKVQIEEARRALNEKIEKTGRLIDAYEESVRLDKLIEEYETLKKKSK